MARRRKRHAHERSAASRRAFDKDRRSKAYKNFLRREARGLKRYWAEKRRKKSNRWIQRAFKKSKRGSLHRALGVPLKKRIPVAKLRWAAHQRGLLGKRARMVLNLRGLSSRPGLRFIGRPKKPVVAGGFNLDRSPAQRGRW